MATKTTKPQAPRTVFYAWQSDSPPQANRFFIREALKKALRAAATADGGTPPLEYDDATRGAAGSVLIVDSILGKIDACDVFVGDISIISPAEQAPRRVPNPNVTFEAGWAAARLGWNRVVLVFNWATGTIEHDVPFDLRGRLILQYELRDGAADRKTVEGQRVGALAGVIRAALDSPRPVRRRAGATRATTISREQHHQRDPDTLYRLLGRLNTAWVDGYLEHLREERIPDDAETQYLAFTGVAAESRFRLFDRRTDAAVRAFVAAWDRLHEASRYGDSVVGRRYARFRPESYGHGADVVRMRRELHDALAATEGAYRALVVRVHAAYPEFDFHESDARARAYVAAL